MVLYRPVGLAELKLIEQSGFKKFPPRLKEQPIFYPVTNREYAKQIAMEWNCKDAFSGYAGFVLSFTIDEEYIKAFEKKVVGNSFHEELWIPAEKLNEFNTKIIGKIKLEEYYFGEDYKGTTTYCE